MSARGEHCHEIVVKLCRALGRRYRIKYRAVQSGNVANRNRPGLLTSERHGRCAEAGGDCAEAAGKYRGISPDIVNRSNVIGFARSNHRWVRFNIREACQAGEGQQQL